MSNRKHPRALRRTALAVLLGAALAQGAVHAQSTSGDIVGTASTAAGEKVVIKSLNSGVTREVTAGADGRFRVPSLPTGQYEVSAGGQTTTVTVIAGQSSTANFVDATSLETITVRGGALSSIDLSSTQTRTTFTAEQLNTLPVARDVTSVSLLTPGTVSSSGYFGNASFGGASAAENSYYINGFNVTNLYDNLSFSEVPYQAIDQLDVQTGGYGARYGFSTGGVTSVNVKRGTNEWKGGASWTYAPDALREQPDNVKLNNGDVFRSYKNNESDSSVYSIWAGGPLIQDKLFVFALASLSDSDSTSFGTRTSGYANYPAAMSTTRSTTAYDSSAKMPYYLLKLDWYLNDSNHLEFTGFSNNRRTEYQNYNAAFDSIDGDARPNKTAFSNTEVLKNGGHTGIFKWTSYLTDNLTMALQYGEMHNKNEYYSVNAAGVVNKYDGNVFGDGPTCPYVLDYNPASPTYGSIIGCSTIATTPISNGMNQRDAGRIDFEWQLGDHKVSFGYSDEKWKSKQGDAQFVYYINGTGDDVDGGELGDPNANVYDVVRYLTGGSIQVDQKSWYIEDNWNITDNFMLYLGIRNDSFENKNGSGATFIKQDNIWQPRVGFTWDVLGDGSSKIYGSVGRYSLPIAANVALRAASASYFTDTYYTYDGTLDPVTKVPTPTGSYADGAYDQVYNGEDGSTPDPRAVASKGLKPYTADEAILGYQQLLSSDNTFLDGWTLGIKATYRKVHNAIDDTCDTRAIYNVASAAGYDLSNWGDEWNIASGLPGCYLFNPGQDLTVTMDVDGNGTADTITVPGSDLGPKAKRNYKAVTLSADKNTDRWYVSASYTWSKLDGNYEGLIKSTNGQDDTGTTSDFDFKELMYGADGYLFNDHRHSLKLYGGYKFSDEWEVGLNILAQSGSPKSCLGGGVGSYDTEYGYAGVFHVCDYGDIVTGSDRASDDVPSKVGSAGRTPWLITVSPNVTYRPSWLPGLSAQVSVFNLFNQIEATQVYEAAYSYSGASTRVYNNYGQPKYFSTPRYVRFQLQYDW
ncbi:TonB-dependent receptor plug domain-containing protein [Stenotrophomonas sp. MMGLT7]|uniref:TonB-dependent receptor n=1 Tax=Stenotrophomonas sp. MMGLT7 TaxID=2901227 RepID=UPI001E6416B4|nr:TonB-dependent receptor plug domain-containing protein [Stenotrophomonas sp. MMGLT7]MCD7100063.1 TonB-dependent receptor plug domain-containing protein [Stenotrophomonas sp. MMGLT7]